MGSTLNNILDTVIPDLSGIGSTLQVVFWGAAVVAVYFIFEWLTNRPKKYSATIFENIGGVKRPRPGTVLRYDTKTKRGYYVDGCDRKQTFDLDDAELMAGKKVHFFLQKLEDGEIEIYLPVKFKDKSVELSEAIKMVDSEGKEIEVTELSGFEFVARADLKALDHAAIEGIEEDVEPFSWTDKLGFISAMTQIGGLLIIFILAAYVFKQISPITTELKAAVVEIQAVAIEMGRVANSYEIIAAYYELEKPPPG